MFVTSQDGGVDGSLGSGMCRVLLERNGQQVDDCLACCCISDVGLAPGSEDGAAKLCVMIAAVS